MIDYDFFFKVVSDMRELSLTNSIFFLLYLYSKIKYGMNQCQFNLDKRYSNMKEEGIYMVSDY